MASAIIPAITGALANQSRARSSMERPITGSALPVILAADKKRLKKITREADKERLYNLISQPEVLGLVITLGGMLAAQNIPFSSNKTKNEALKATATSASVLLGLGYAGVGDLTTLLVAATAGGGSLAGSLLGDAPGAGILDSLNPTKWQNWVPGYNLLTGD